MQFKFVDLYVVNNFVSQLFFRISYNLTGKWNLDIDFFQVLNYRSKVQVDLLFKPLPKCLNFL